LLDSREGVIGLSLDDLLAVLLEPRS
jgi:hypothetical protein